MKDKCSDKCLGEIAANVRKPQQGNCAHEKMKNHQNGGNKFPLLLTYPHAEAFKVPTKRILRVSLKAPQPTIILVIESSRHFYEIEFVHTYDRELVSKKFK